MHEIVGPFELDTLESDRFERSRQRNTRCKRQAGEKACALFEAPCERERQAAAGDRGPSAPPPSPPRGLPFRCKQLSMDVVTPLRPPRELAIGRIDTVDDFDARFDAGLPQRMQDRRTFEERGWIE